MSAMRNVATAFTCVYAFESGHSRTKLTMMALIMITMRSA